MKKKFSTQTKAQVALAAIKGEKTMAQISSEYKVHPTQIGLWKKQALDQFTDLFHDNRKEEKQKETEYQTEKDSLYKMIGQRDQELEWLKKKLSIFNLE